MEDTIKVTCPDCQTILVVRRRDGQILEVRKPILAESTGDRVEDALIKVRGEKDAVAKKFEEAQAKEKGKMERLNALFKEGIKRAQEEGPITKQNPLEMD